MSAKSAAGQTDMDAAAHSRAERERLAIEARNRSLFELAPDGILIADPQSVYLDANPGMCRMLGYSRDELVGLHASDIVAPGEIEQIGPALDAIRSTSGYQREWRFRRKDGSIFDADVIASALPDGNLLAMVRDITPLKLREQEIQRISRLYATLSQVNQAIVWTKDRDELLRKTCQVLVEQGGFGMAWIGWHDPDTHLLRPVAVSGDESGYIRSIVVYADDRQEGRGPSGTAFRSGRPYISNDMLNDPATLPWRPELERRGFRASAVFPIRLDGAVCATLSVYSDQPWIFQDKEIALLEEAAGDVSFALDNLAREQQRREVEGKAQSEKLFSDTMIDSMPGIVYFYDETGRFLRWNRNFEQVSGYCADEIARMHPLDFFPPEEKSMLLQRIAEVFEHGESSVEASFVSKDGSTTPYLFTGRRVAFEYRPCLVGVGIDITQRTRAEAAVREAESRFAVVVENLSEGLVIADPQADLLHWNPESLRLLGFADPEEGRQHQHEFAHIFELSTLDGSLLPPEQWPLARTRRGELVADLELRVRRLDMAWERIICYSGRQVRYADNKLLAFVTLNDVTDRKQAQRLLQESHENLEHKVAERTRELQSALIHAEDADRLKSAFLATMSHELRTPLNSIIGFTGIILQGLAGPLNPEQAKQLGMVRGSARHLLDLINDVLDISKIEAGQLEIHAESFDLRESLERVIASVRPLAATKGLRLDLAIQPGVSHMVSDRRRVEQIVLNLLNNAIKFTQHGGVKLTAELQQAPQASIHDASGQAVRLRVIDTGMGIRADDLGKLFQPFHQIDSGLTRQHEGTGLGLAICRRLSALLGGEIAATSEWAKGSAFTVTLPRQWTSET